MHDTFFDAGEPVTLRNLGRIDKKPIEAFLQNGAAGGAAGALGMLFSSIGETHMKSTLMRLYITLDVHIAAKAFAEDIGVEREVFLQCFGSAEQAVQHIHTRESVRRYLADMLDQCVAWRRVYSRGSAFMIEKAKAYINEQYTGEDISLERVAAAVNVSPAYFSHLFKKEVGVSLISYITALRMEKAKNLLSCSNMKISEVARQVGYSDYHYFSGMFKRHAGLTPSEFRAMRETGNTR